MPRYQLLAMNISRTNPGPLTQILTAHGYSVPTNNHIQIHRHPDQPDHIMIIHIPEHRQLTLLIKEGVNHLRPIILDMSDYSIRTLKNQLTAIEDAIEEHETRSFHSLTH